MAEKLVVGVTHLIKPPFDAELAALGEDVEIIHFDTRNEQEFDPDQLRRLDVFLVWTPYISSNTIAHLTNCKIVVRYGVGYDKIDRDALQRAGIAFSNNPEYGPEDVADTAMSMLLCLQRRILQHDQLSRGYSGSWQENHLAPTIHSRHCTVGVIGIGRIGISVINRLKPFGYEIIGYDPYISNGMARAVGIERIFSLSELTKRSNMITMHCPLTEETKGMINAQVVNEAEPGLIFVNTARGMLIESLDLIEQSLKSGQMAAAGLDVLPVEPPQSHSLIDAWRNHEEWLKGRLIITPHNAFYSDYSMYEARYNAAETARLFLQENKHRNAVSEIL